MHATTTGVPRRREVSRGAGIGVSGGGAVSGARWERGEGLAAGHRRASCAQKHWLNQCEPMDLGCGELEPSDLWAWEWVTRDKGQVTRVGVQAAGDAGA